MLLKFNRRASRRKRSTICPARTGFVYNKELSEMGAKIAIECLKIEQNSIKIFLTLCRKNDIINIKGVFYQ
jgi:hypothetical protein